MNRFLAVPFVVLVAIGTASLVGRIRIPVKVQLHLLTLRIRASCLLHCSETLRSRHFRMCHRRTVSIQQTARFISRLGSSEENPDQKRGKVFSSPLYPRPHGCRTERGSG
jgi:hypothetical protein